MLSFTEFRQKLEEETLDEASTSMIKNIKRYFDGWRKDNAKPAEIKKDVESWSTEQIKLALKEMEKDKKSGEKAPWLINFKGTPFQFELDLLKRELKRRGK